MNAPTTYVFGKFTLTAHEWVRTDGKADDRTRYIVTHAPTGNKIMDLAKHGDPMEILVDAVTFWAGTKAPKDDHDLYNPKYAPAAMIEQAQQVWEDARAAVEA